MNLKYIFISAPHGHPDVSVIYDRMKRLRAIVAQYVINGHLVLAPNLHFHELTQEYSLPLDWDYWKDNCYAMMQNAYQVDVIMLEGWEKSVGVKAEIEYAKTLNILVNYVDPEKLPFARQ